MNGSDSDIGYRVPKRKLERCTNTRCCGGGEMVRQVNRPKLGTQASILAVFFDIAKALLRQFCYDVGTSHKGSDELRLHLLIFEYFAHFSSSG